MTISDWIPADDLLPTPEDCGCVPGPGGLSPEVLVAVTAYNGARFVSLDRYDRDTGEWLDHTLCAGQRVTHWMRLPQPPEAASHFGSGFAARLSIAIERAILLECDVAQRSGIDATAINHFTRGRREPRRANLARLLCALPGVDARWLICG